MKPSSPERLLVSSAPAADLTWSTSAVNFFRAALGTALGKARLSTEANASCGSDDNPSEERAHGIDLHGFWPRYQGAFRHHHL